MSNLSLDALEEPSSKPESPELRIIKPRKISLHTRNGTEVFRNLPHRELRSIGPWCFLDQFGPIESSDAMRVAAHPHTGLQTVTWLFEGSVLHQDSLGTKTLVKPGELNLMTSGYGIAHSELSINSTGNIHGIQLWVALPNEYRFKPPSFEHHKFFPIKKLEGIQIKVFAGSHFGLSSPATFFGELVGAEIELTDSDQVIEIDKDWEYGLLSITGDAQIEDRDIHTRELLHIPRGSSSLRLSSSGSAKLLLIGGPPLTEKIVMWWNFVARSHDEIIEMREAWESQSHRFPSFESEIPERIPAPTLPNIRLSAR